MKNRERMNIVITGHVDHGKSTIIGKLLADTGSLPDGKLEFVKKQCELNSKPFEYAFLLDALKDEQSQGITIDTARVFFTTLKRDYIILDAPGHIEFLKNMVTGASRAEAALIVIDAEEGIKENSMRHGYLLSMLGIKQIIVLINKMDLVNYSQEVYQKIQREYSAFLQTFSISPICFIPVSGRFGINIAKSCNEMPWFSGNTVVAVLDNLVKEKSDMEKPFRMPVQDIYKFTNFGDSRRIIVGTVESGIAKCGDEIIFYPSGKKTKIKTIESFNENAPIEISQGMAVGFTTEEQIYIKRGEIAVKSGEIPPHSGKNLLVSLFWLGLHPFKLNKEYFLKAGTAKVGVKLIEVQRIINSSDLSSLESNQFVNKNEVAECLLSLYKPIAFDCYSELASTGRFVIVDNYEIAGGGIIKSALKDQMSWLREKVFQRNFRWEKSSIPQEDRAEKYHQKPKLILITGEVGVGKKTIAKKLETILFQSGKIVYFLGIGNVKYGIDADIDRISENREEHLRRTAEVSNVILDAGIILIVTARNLTNDNLELFKSIINPECILTIWTGKTVTTDIVFDLNIPGISDVEESISSVIDLLDEKNNN